MKTSITNGLALAAMLAALSIGISTSAQAQTRALDRVVAIVDDGIILESELRQREDFIRANMAQAGKEEPQAAKLRRETLDLLILESLQLQMAERAGVRIDDAQLNATMARIAAQNNMSLEQFQQALEAQGSYVAQREQLRRDLLLQRVQQGNVNHRVNVSEQEIDSYLRSAEGRDRTAAEYRLFHILVPTPKNADDFALSNAEALAKQVVRRLRAGDDFGAVAANYSVQPSDLGWLKEGDVPDLFINRVRRMDDREIADPIKSASGFHIIQLAASRGHKELIAQTRASHILLKASAIRTEEQTRALAESIRQRALGGESFAELAKEFSTDIGSAREGGDLGWTSPGQLVPEFEKVMQDTKINDISLPVKTRYGWHIIKVTERRKKDVTNDMRYNMARNILHQRKFKEELDIWLRKIRDEAYVDIK